MEQDVILSELRVCYLLKRICRMRIAICDDEYNFVTFLKPMINRYGNTHRFETVVDEYASGEELINSSIIYDVIFLDYQMGGIDGMQTARILRKKNVVCAIIFVTNYPDFVYEAFEVDTFRFLKKPLNENQVHNTLNSYFDKFGNDYPILLRCEGETVAVDTKDIVFLEAKGKHCRIHTINSCLECAKTMMVISKMLPLQHFYRVNKAFIINYNYIDRYTYEEIIFKNGEKAYISRNYFKAFRTAYRDYSALKNPNK